jgi:6-phosphogluconolactonase (cycloisomerase 2 family)
LQFIMVNFTIIGAGYTAALSAFTFDSSSGKLSLTGTTANANSPSWLEAAAGGKAVFAALETTPGGIESFTVGASGALTSVSRTESGGIPVALAALKNGKEIVTANYDTGLVVSYPIDADGVTLGAGVNGAQLTGSGPVAGRQDSPHPHHIIEYNDEVLISDLGSDMVWRLTKDAAGAYQVAGKIPQKAGSGPRHLAAADSKLFVVSELDNTLSYYTLPELPAAKPISAKFRKFRRQCSAPAPPATTQPAPPSTEAPVPTSTEAPTVPTETPVTPPSAGAEAELVNSASVLPSDPPAGATWGAAEVILSPDNKFVYASNRNVGTQDERGDPIAIFSVEPFALVKHVYTKLTHVRGMVMSADGKYIIAAGQNAGGVVVYEVGADGDLTELDRYTGPGSEKLATFAWL